MGLTLYEIDNLYYEALRLATDEQGEIKNDSMAKFLDEIAELADVKMCNIAAYIKNLKAEAEAHKAEAKLQTEKARIAENKAERLKGYLLSYMSPGQKLKDPRVEITWRKSQSLEVTVDPEQLPKEYQRITMEIDKRFITETIKAGGTVEGCQLVEKENLVIK